MCGRVEVILSRPRARHNAHHRIRIFTHMLFLFRLLWWHSQSQEENCFMSHMPEGGGGRGAVPGVSGDCLHHPVRGAQPWPARGRHPVWEHPCQLLHQGELQDGARPPEVSWQGQCIITIVRMLMMCLQVSVSVIDQPEEHCDLVPNSVCRHKTKLVPRLRPECVLVPQQVCDIKHVNTRLERVPSVTTLRCQDDVRTLRLGQTLRDILPRQ